MELHNKIDDLDFLNDGVNAEDDVLRESGNFFFDDEPVEEILYGEESKGPTSANLYLPALQYLGKMKHLQKNNAIPKAIDLISALAGKRFKISIPTCFRMASILGEIVPLYPNPIIKHDLSGLEPLLKKIWYIGLKHHDKELQGRIGTVFYRWHECLQRNEDARRVLETLLKNNNREGKGSAEEAFLLNEIAFTYLLERRYRDGAPLFARAAKISLANGDGFNHANSRANYWLCRLRFGGRGKIELAEVEREVKESMEVLARGNGWHARKPHILLALVEEQRGNIDLAIQFAERSIEVSRGCNTRYAEEDTDYLEQLQRKR